MHNDLFHISNLSSKFSHRRTVVHPTRSMKGGERIKGLKASPPLVPTSNNSCHFQQCYAPEGPTSNDHFQWEAHVPSICLCTQALSNQRHVQRKRLLCTILKTHWGLWARDCHRRFMQSSSFYGLLIASPGKQIPLISSSCNSWYSGTLW